MNREKDMSKESAKLNLKKKIILAIIAVFLLFTGGLIYVHFRTPNILLFRFLDLIHFDYHTLQNTNISLHPFFIYHFPDALYVLFGYLFVYIIWDNDGFHFSIYSSLITFGSIVYEITTKDISDIITILATYFIFMAFYLMYLGAKHEK